MPSGLAQKASAAALALRAVGRNPGLRWLELSWALSVCSTWIFLVAALIVAYRSAGPAGVGAVGLVRMIPAALAAPFVVLLERRFAGQRLLVAIHATRLVSALAVAAGLVAGVRLVVLLAVVGLKAAAGVFVRPTMFGLLPALAAAPDELVAATVAASTGEGAGTLVGPVIGGLVVAAFGPVAACLVAASVVGAALVAAALVRVTTDAVVRPAAGSPGRAVRVGVAALRRHGGARLVIVCFFAQVIVRGILSVLLVVASIELLGLGDSGVGLLNASIGLGGFAGAFVALGIAGVRRVSIPFALALAGWGLPIAAIGGIPTAIVAVLALVALGASNAVLDVSGFTLLQRLVPNAERTAVFGLLESVGGAGVAIGSALAPVLLGLLPARAALVVTGLSLPIVALAAWRGLAHVDEEAVVPERELALLRSLPMFAPLPMTVIERLAGRLVRVDFPPGDLLMRQGDPADCFYGIESGEVEVIQDGRRLGSRGPGSAIGEIGLLRHVPRTATVRATAQTVAFALLGEEFVAAVTGNPASAGAADSVIATRLATDVRAPQFAAAATDTDTDQAGSSISSST